MLAKDTVVAAKGSRRRCMPASLQAEEDGNAGAYDAMLKV